MKYCQFKYQEVIYCGEVIGDSIHPLSIPESQPSFGSREIIDRIVHINEVEFLPPTEPSKIVCVGRNYAAHAAELGNQVPTEPLLFLKAPSSIITDKDKIIIPEQSAQVEFEGELGLVIGRFCKNLDENTDWQQFVFGYICLNDVTARDLQKRDVQFTRAKSFDTFCPISSIIETELDVTDVRLVTKVNDEIKQDCLTSQMVFSISFLLRYISKQMTLNPGDIIATGTPSGVSRLNSGDVCTVEIEGLGQLQNSVV